MPRNKKGGPPSRRGKDKKHTHSAGRNTEELSALNSFLRNVGERAQNHPQTLQEVAWHTRQSPHAWATDAKLRNSAVKFISSGSYTGEDLLDEKDTLAASDKKLEESQASLRSLKIQDNAQDKLIGPQRFPKTFLAQGSRSPETGSGKGEYSGESGSQQPFFAVDLVGDVSLKATEAQAHRPASPAPSNSSGEVVLFKGRKRTRGNEPSSIPQSSVNRDLGMTSNYGHDETLPTTPRPDSKKEKSPIRHNPQAVSVQNFDLDLGEGYAIPEVSDAAILEDYISNLRASGELDEVFQSGLIPSRELDIHLTTHSPSSSPNRNDIASGWTRSDLQDFDDLATSFTCSESIHAILSKRDRPNGVQYLVIWEGYTVDDARWIPRTSLNMPDAENLIDIFEEEERRMHEYAASESSSDKESEELDIIPDNFIESDEDIDDEDLWRRRVDRLSDEKIAQLLAKQEELGLGSEILKIIDDSAEHIEIPQKLKKAGKKSFSSPREKAARGRQKGKQSLLDLDLEDGMADESDDFNVMEFGNRRLRSSTHTFDTSLFAGISDSDLEMQMHSSWMKDRERKRIKKQERQQLRAQGLLGSKNGKPDLKAKYPETMSPQEVINEILSFLDSNAQSLPLPPMRDAERKTVHEIAQAFSLKSKSIGKGVNRFPVLYKTARSALCDGATVASITSRLQRRLPRMVGRGTRGPAIPRRTGGASAGVHYRDGDIVGAAAPELGAENRGRAMLEKMGWSTGTALGALNNKGILQPVAHVVKTSKAGLG